MPNLIPNPYTGDDEETCSVSFTAQQKLNDTDVSGQQTEAEHNQSKQLGEWGVIQAKLKKGQIPDGTKVLTYTNDYANSRGYIYVKGGKLAGKKYVKGVGKEFPITDTTGKNMIQSTIYKTAIPQSVKPQPKPEGVPFTKEDAQAIGDDPYSWPDNQKIAVNAAGDYVIFSKLSDTFAVYTPDVSGYGYAPGNQSYSLATLTKDGGWFKVDKSTGKPKTTTPTTKVEAQVAAPTPAPAVNPGSDSVGSMSDQDVSAMFVKIKDDVAKELGLGVKGSNSDLDALVYKSIGGKTGYTPAEVKAKIDAYKAAGNKLSALKKKVMAGTYQVPKGKNEGTKPQDTKATPAAPLAGPDPAKAPPIKDPEPNGVPTVATPKLADAVKADVKATVNAEPNKVYTDEDVVAAYIIAKDAVVAGSNGKWTLYSKSDEMDLQIAIQVGLKTGLNPLQQKEKIANYLASGKKISTLKKQLIKQGTLKPQADTLKKSGAAKTQAEKDADVDTKAAAGYTPTSTPTTTTSGPAPKMQDYPGDSAGFKAAYKAWSDGEPVKMQTDKNPTKAHVRADAELGDIDSITQAEQFAIFQEFKLYGQYSYLSSPTGYNYEGFVKLQNAFKGKGKDYTLLQLVRVIDAQGAKKAGVDNGHLFEAKVIKWLSSPEGTQYIKDNEAKLAKEAELAKKKAEAEAAAKILEANQPPLPADSRQFEEMTPDKALQVQKRMLAKKPFGPGEKAGLTHYTGGAYHAMNGHLRAGSSVSGTDKSSIEPAIRGFRPSDIPMLLRRGTGANQFVTLGAGRGEAHLLWGMAGKTFEDKGFLSTSAAGRAAFGGEVMMEIEAPVGTPMMYVDKLLNDDGTTSRFSKHSGENEMLLRPGLKYKILNVRKEGSTYVVRVRVVDWPGKAD